MLRHQELQTFRTLGILLQRLTDDFERLRRSVGFEDGSLPQNMSVADARNRYCVKAFLEEINSY